ncbi:hypothetical protein LEP1GSC024_0196 [Leptospira noguchii str. 2001034031]|uniref:Uncharacterized protein n=1 Tax=Leptospira noguchii str. 2001034031 TaxID=1193053 RepID=M6YFF3_9LEPT|nr:hypothetical protein LEP1GSC024_0196 [Leptospira noguchii str. 2001034031]
MCFELDPFFQTQTIQPEVVQSSKSVRRNTNILDRKIIIIYKNFKN